jgi:hypothetical protein
MHDFAYGSLVFLAALWSAGIGFLLGLGAFLLFFSYKVKLNIRKRLQFERYDLKKPVDWLSETRQERRQQIESLPVNIRAPVLDAAGIPVINEEIRFQAILTELSSRGATIISPYFIPLNVIALISCGERKLTFPLQEARVKDLSLEPHGVRIGLQFLKPLRVLT